MPIKNWIKYRYKTRYFRKIRDYFHYLIGLIGTACLLPFQSTDSLSAKNIKRILLIRLDRIGDMVLTTPAFAAIRSAFPNARITLLSRSYVKPLVISNPNLDQFIEYDRSFSFYAKIRVIGQLRLLRSELAIVLNTDFSSGLIAFLSGAKYRIGNNHKEAGFFFTTAVNDQTRSGQIKHTVESTLDLIRALKVPMNEKKELFVSITEEGEKYVVQFFKKHKLDDTDLIIAIHPGSRQPYIRWRKEGFAEVADRLIEEYNAKVILIGGPGESQIINDVLSLMKYSSIVIDPPIKLTELVSLLNRCHLFIGNSTGTMHIAAALKVPVVAIFGSKHPMDSYKKWSPWGEGHIVVSRDVGCLECHPGDCARDFECMKLISADNVLKAVEKSNFLTDRTQINTD
ncbi:TPA: glycosyltransferase family 9 protein [Candidatus Poribacteria bacterium]|nr:glycosyltransferase family 9 protein [Candidatus Poribacteria bacterium]